MTQTTRNRIDWTHTLDCYGIGGELAPLYETATQGVDGIEIEEMIANWDDEHGRMPSPGELSSMLRQYGTLLAAS